MKNSLNADELSSDIFRMPASRALSTMCLLYARPWIVASVLILVVGMAAWGFTLNLRWCILSLMILFIVFPMVASFLYYSYGLRRECFLNVVEHDVALVEEGVRIRLYRNETFEESNEIPVHESDTQDSLSDKESVPRALSVSSEFILPFSDLRPFIAASSSVVIPVGKGFIWLPNYAFPGSGGLTDFMKIVGDKMSESRRVG